MPSPPKSTLAWLPLTAAGLIGGLAAGALTGRLFGPRPPKRPPPRRRTWVDPLGRAAIHPNTLAVLKRALLGVDRKGILQLLGPPAAAGDANGAVRAPAGRQFRDAATWYYPLDDEKKLAMALRFERGVAADAEFLRDPEKPTRPDV